MGGGGGRGGGRGRVGFRTRSRSVWAPSVLTGEVNGRIASVGALVMRRMWCSGCRDFFWQICWRTVERGVFVLTLRGMECAKVEVGEMWIRRVFEGAAVTAAVVVGGMMGKVEAGVEEEEEVGRRVEGVGGIISVVGIVDVWVVVVAGVAFFFGELVFGVALSFSKSAAKS